MKLLVILPFIMMVIYIVLNFIWSRIKHIKEINAIRKFSDFTEKVLSWESEIKEREIKVKYMEYCMNLLLTQSDLKKIKFDEEMEIMKITEIFGKYIPELQRIKRDKQIKKIIN